MEHNTCAGYFTSNLGDFPSQIAATAAAVRWSMQACCMLLATHGRDGMIEMCLWSKAAAAGAVQVATAIVFYPVSSRKGGRLVVQAWLQGLAWVERTREADLAARNARLSGLVKVALP